MLLKGVGLGLSLLYTQVLSPGNSQLGRETRFPSQEQSKPRPLAKVRTLHTDLRQILGLCLEPAVTQKGAFPVGPLWARKEQTPWFLGSVSDWHFEKQKGSNPLKIRLLFPRAQACISSQDTFPVINKIYTMR